MQELSSHGPRHFRQDRPRYRRVQRYRRGHRSLSINETVSVEDGIRAGLLPGPHQDRRLAWRQLITGDLDVQAVPGEEARRIDWRRSARDDNLYVREREWEAAHTIWLWPDRSPSMAFSSRLARESGAVSGPSERT